MFALVKNETVTDPVTEESSVVDVIKLYAPYTIFEDKNGTQYSPDTLLSWSVDQKQDAGIYDVAYGLRPDDRFYSVTENSAQFDSAEKIVKITYSSTAKDLEDNGDIKGLKSQWITSFKDTANSLLSESDWMLIRKVERDVDIPAATATYRAAVIAEAARLETAITESTDIESFITVVESAAWPTAE